jgi:hypothetical protein
VASWVSDSCLPSQTGEGPSFLRSLIPLKITHRGTRWPAELSRHSSRLPKQVSKVFDHDTELG